jgi:hypothetical protein
MATLNQPSSTPPLMKIPVGYPVGPSPGKISLLFDANSKNIYHKFDANNYDDGNGFGFTQPYIYRYPGDEPSGILEFDNLLSRTDDVIRIGKFLTSGRGVVFAGKQFLLQGFQPFDETNIYNPTEIVLSAASNLTDGLLSAPKRHIDTSGGLLGGLAALVGVGISRGAPPPSTVAAGDGSGGSTDGNLFGGFSLLGNTGGNRESEVLPTQNYGNATGLLRAKTAIKARSVLQAHWGVSSGGGSNGFMSFIKNLAKSIIPQAFGSDKQNFKQRADELAYDWMIKYYNDNTAINRVVGTQVSNGLSINIFGINIKKPSDFRLSTQLTNSTVIQFKQKYFSQTEDGSFTYNKDGVFVDGDVEQSDILDVYDDSYYKNDEEGLIEEDNTYFDEKSWKPVDGKSPIENAYNTYKQNNKTVSSTELVNNSDYIERYEGSESEFSVPFDNLGGKKANTRSTSQNTKLNKSAASDDPASIINDNLKKVLTNIGLSGVYKVDITNNDNWLLQSGNSILNGYDRLHSIASDSVDQTGINNNAENGVIRTYNDVNVRTLDSIVNPNRNVGLAGSSRSDKINTLTVLDSNKAVKETLLSNYTEWKPYEDDLIAFFFYDVVNEKYIPFRATVKSINESNNALWDELRFMGRADALYSYTGFTRNLSFSFTVVVNSLLELHPVWKRINYLASSVKPSGYTKKDQGDNILNKFMIPPMFMLTIGDLYKYQPIVITSVNVVIPEGASWETVPENSTEDWTYMAKMIKSKVPKSRIGQVPREIEISITTNVLEKELPQTGGNHYGHSPVDENGFQIVGNQPYLPTIEDFSKDLREVVPQNFEG